MKKDGGNKRKATKRLCLGAQWAKKKNRKGRAMGGMVMGIKREIVEKGKGIEIRKEGMIVGKVKSGEQSWRVVGVYINGNMKEQQSARIYHYLSSVYMYNLYATYCRPLYRSSLRVIYLVCAITACLWPVTISFQFKVILLLSLIIFN